MADNSRLTPGRHKHALITGPIQGYVPVQSPKVSDDFVDVTPDTLHFDKQDEALAVADGIEEAHWERNTHPAQLALDELATAPESDPSHGDHKAWQAAHKQATEVHTEVEKRVSKRVAAYKKGPAR